jgi:hypothetical protein
MAMVDPDRFDEIAVAAATEPVSRGRVLKMLFAALLGGGGLLMSANEAQAACQRVGQRCGDGRGRCCSGARCRRGRCRCKAGLTNCGGRCFDLQTSRKHCGTCNNPCSDSPREVCQSGDCCRPSFTLCTDVCAAGTNCDACCSGFCFSDNTC